MPSTTRWRRRRAGLPPTRRWSLHSPRGAVVQSPARRSAELVISRQEHGHASVAGTPLTRWRRVCYVHCRRCCSCAVLCAPFSSFRFSPVAVITLHRVYCIITL